MFCSKCGEILRDGTRKCPVCGARLDRRTSSVNAEKAPSGLQPGLRRSKVSGDPYDLTHYECQEKDCSQVNFTCRHSSGVTFPAVGFPEAIRLFFTRYQDFRGRSTRSEFWWALLMVTLVALFLGGFGLAGAWALLTLVPSFTLSMRRLHDVGLPGYFMLVLLIPFIGTILFLVLAAQPSGKANRWGSPSV